MKYLKWLPAIFWVAIICVLSFSELKTISIPRFFSADKIAHFGMYGFLSVLLYIAAGKNIKCYGIYVLGAVILALLTELIQHYFVENRYGEVGDFIANVLGLGVVYITIQRKVVKLNI